MHTNKNTPVTNILKPNYTEQQKSHQFPKSIEPNEILHEDNILWGGSVTSKRTNSIKRYF